MCALKSINELLHVREEYGQASLLESDMHPDPFEQFKNWVEAYAILDPKNCNAMVLSTIDHHNHPDSRVVLLKELRNGEFIFFTHYTSTKGLQIEANPHVALNFFWSLSYQQIRIRGKAHRVSAEQSDEYFYSRPLESQLSSIASDQSQVMPDRAALFSAFQQVTKEHAHAPVIRPESWGGYAIVPNQIEFWQGRDNRLHDRIQYYLQDEKWQMRRLAP